MFSAVVGVNQGLSQFFALPTSVALGTPQWHWVACEVLMAGHFCSLIPVGNANGKAIPHLFFQRQQADRSLLLSSG